MKRTLHRLSNMQCVCGVQYTASCVRAVGNCFFGSHSLLLITTCLADTFCNLQSVGVQHFTLFYASKSQPNQSLTAQPKWSALSVKLSNSGFWNSKRSLLGNLRLKAYCEKMKEQRESNKLHSTIDSTQ